MEEIECEADGCNEKGDELHPCALELEFGGDVADMFECNCCENCAMDCAYNV